MIRMKNLKYILLTLVSILFITACSDDKENPVFDSSKVTAPTLAALSNAYTLTKDKADATFSDFNFTAANWGLNLASTYVLQASLTQDFAKEVDLGKALTGATTIPVTNAAINSILINNKVTPGTATPVYFRILATADGETAAPTISSITSPVVTATVTPYNTEVIYPKVYIVGDYNGWSHDKDLFLFSFESNSIYSGIIDFGSKVANGWKITPAPNWDNDWGMPEAPATDDPTTLQLGKGGNISCYKANEFYNFTFDTSTMKLTKNFAFNVLSIVGDAGSEVNGWGTKEVDMTFNTAKQTFTAEVTFAEGQIKFRANHDWALNWGGSDGILKPGGDNLKITKAGKYLVTVNLNNPDKLTYTLEIE